MLASWNSTSNSHAFSPRRGFSLIEVLVVIGIVGLLMALMLPAIQGAREAARRMQCASNLRQLALGMQTYQERQGTFPMGSPQYHYDDVGLHIGHSWLVATLGDLEQSSLYHSVNFSRNIYTSANMTIQATGLNLFMCPSDPSIRLKWVCPTQYQDMPAKTFVASFASYAACAGTWYHQTFDVSKMRDLASQDRGIAFVNSVIRSSDITDGLSNTIMLGERNHEILTSSVAGINYWWFDGFHGDTLFWTMYPMNPGVALAVGNIDQGPYLAAAGSNHSGGANFAFADGSVRFLRDTIESWPIDARTRMPIGVSGSLSTPYLVSPQAHFGVYQRLSTRASADLFSN